MKNIVFIDKGGDSIWSSYLSHAYLVEGWERSGLFEICPWHPAARSVRGAIPSLARILGDEDEWNAVVLCDLRSDSSQLTNDRHFDNPFDFADNYDSLPDDEVHESDHAIVRLCQMLGGLPEKVRIAHQSSVEQVVGGGAFEYPRSEDYYDLLERYRIGLPRPTRIICLSPRTYDEELFGSCAQELEAQGSFPQLETGFWERNDYPPSTRFVVYDWNIGVSKDADPSESDYVVHYDASQTASFERRMEAYNWLRFWVGVVTLLGADINSGMLKPYRLYRMEPLVSPLRVREAMASKWSVWEATLEHVQDQLALEYRRVRRAETMQQEAPDCSTNISVKLDMLRSDLADDVRPIRFIRPDHDTELFEWKEQEQTSYNKLRRLLRLPSRAVAKATRRFRQQSVLDPESLEYCVLTNDQLLDLKDEILDEEQSLVETMGKRAFSFKTHTNAFTEHSHKVEKRIDDRTQKAHMVPGVIALSGAGVLGIGACVPQILALGKPDLPTILAGFIVLLSPAVSSLPILYVQRKRLRLSRDSFFDWINSVWKSLDTESRRLGRRMSSYATIRKQWSIAQQQHKLDKPTRRMSELEEYVALITSRMALASMAVGEPEESTDDLVRVRAASWEAISHSLTDDAFFDAFPSYPTRTSSRSVGEAPGSIDVPFEFVEAFNLIALRIH